jgi:sec-independent protein translocase protein TatC
MPLTGHLTELRNRILVILASVTVLFLGTYFFSAELLAFLQWPIAGRNLIFLSPTEAFITRLKVAFFAAVFLSIPVILHQFWRFCSPGLLKKEKHYAVPFVFFSTLCFIGGAVFCYSLILPYGLDFLLSFATETVQPQISVGFYISFVFKLIFVFGIVFEVPVVTLLLVQIGLVTPAFLTSNRSYIIVGAFVLAAALTPPDVITQIFLAGPLIVLYELSVVIAKIVVRKKKEKADEEDTSA